MTAEKRTFITFETYGLRMIYSALNIFLIPTNTSAWAMPSCTIQNSKYSFYQTSMYPL